MHKAPVPKKRATRGRSNRRRNAITKRLESPNLIVCTNCKKLRFPHRACPHCGFYK